MDGKQDDSGTMPVPRIIGIVLLVLIVLTFVICSHGGLHASPMWGSSKPSPDFDEIAEECEIKGDDTFSDIEAGDKGASLSLDIAEDTDISPNPDKGGVKAYECVASATSMPDSTRNKIANTNLLSGTQHDTWGNVKVTWSFDPDDGMHMEFERK